MAATSIGRTTNAINPIKMYAVPDLMWSSRVRGNARGQKTVAIMLEIVLSDERIENRAPAQKKRMNCLPSLV